MKQYNSYEPEGSLVEGKKKGDSYLETDMKKRRENNEKAVEDVVENSKALVTLIEQFEQKVAQLSRASAVQIRNSKKNNDRTNYEFLFFKKKK
jgi:hypothetical protein